MCMAGEGPGGSTLPPGWSRNPAGRSKGGDCDYQELPTPDLYETRTRPLSPAIVSPPWAVALGHSLALASIATSSKPDWTRAANRAKRSWPLSHRRVRALWQTLLACNAAEARTVLRPRKHPTKSSQRRVQQMGSAIPSQLEKKSSIPPRVNSERANQQEGGESHVHIIPVAQSFTLSTHLVRWALRTEHTRDVSQVIPTRPAPSQTVRLSHRMAFFHPFRPLGARFIPPEQHSPVPCPAAQGFGRNQHFSDTTREKASRRTIQRKLAPYLNQARDRFRDNRPSQHSEVSHI